MNIADEDIFELENASHEIMEKTFETLTDKIIAQIMPLAKKTGIGNNKKFAGCGIPWKKLWIVVEKLIKDGLIRGAEREVGKQMVASVSLCDLNQIEVSVINDSNFFHQIPLEQKDKETL